MSLFEKVLVSLDLTDNSLPALEKALELRYQINSNIACLHVVPESGEENQSFQAFYDSNSSSDKLMETYALPWMKNWFSEKNIDIPDDMDLLATMGDPSEQIQKYAEKGDYDLIILGTHGRSGLKRYWVGSVAEEVLRKAPCPVLVEKPEYPDISPE